MSRGLGDVYKRQAQDYYPFGSLEPDRTYSSDNYRFGFNGQEMDNEISGQTGTHTTAMFWEYDSRIGRRWNLDPKADPSLSYYACFSNNPILFVDPMGDTTNYYTKKGKFLGTLYGKQGLNDRTIDEKQYNKLMKEKYLFENVIVGNYNLYLKDDAVSAGKDFDDFLKTDEMEAFLNNQKNVKTDVIDLNSALGYMMRAVYAEMRGGDDNAKSIVAESIRNRSQLPIGTDGRADGTYKGIVNRYYNVSNSNNKSYPVFANPYNYARNNDAEMGAWQASVSAALSAHNANSNVGQGVIYYHSTSSTYWDAYYTKINLGFSVKGIKGLWKK